MVSIFSTNGKLYFKKIDKMKIFIFHNPQFLLFAEVFYTFIVWKCEWSQYPLLLFFWQPEWEFWMKSQTIENRAKVFPLVFYGEEFFLLMGFYCVKSFDVQ
jgi:hypothetical protein